MLKPISILFILLMYVNGFSQTTTIIGHAESYPNQTISVWKYKDYISKTEEKLATTTIDSFGNYSFNIDIDTITYITLKIENYRASFYAETAHEYEVKLAAHDTTTYLDPNLEHDVDIAIKLKSKTDINSLTIDYEQRFAYFLTDSITYVEFVKRTPRKALEEFKAEMYEFYSTVDNPFFKQYIAYSIAELEEKVKEDTETLFDEYMRDKPVLYSHPEYFKFFNAFFKDYLKRIALSDKGKAFTELIEKKSTYSDVVFFLKHDKYLKNDTLAELVLIKGLQESYHDNYFFQDSVVSLLKQISKMSSVRENRAIAANVLTTFSNIYNGAKAPSFELEDENRLTRSLEEMLASRYVYVGFFKTTSDVSLEHLKIFSALHKKYGRNIELVSICLDKEFATFKNFCMQHPEYNWTLLYNNMGKQLQKEYEIHSTPTYYLISLDGTFIQAPAESPEENIQHIFHEVTKNPSKYQHEHQRVGERKNY